MAGTRPAMTLGRVVAYQFRCAVVPGIAQHAAGQRAGVLAVLQQHLTVHDRHVDADRRLLDAPAAGGEVVHDALRARLHRVRIEQHDVRREARRAAGRDR